MFRRSSKNPDQASSNRPHRRRAIASPELLEPRNLPGAILHLAAPFASPLNSLSEISAVIATESAVSSKGKVGSYESSAVVKPAAGASAFDRLSLLTNTALNNGQTGNSSVKTTHPVSVSSPSSSGAVANNVSSAVGSNVFTSLTSLMSSASKQTVLPEVQTAPLTAQPMPFTASGGSGDGGGGSNNSGGGPPASGPAGASALGSLQASAAKKSSAPTVSAPAASKERAAAAAPILLVANPTIAAADVKTFLDRAAAATSRNDAIIAIVDRNGTILGVRVEGGVPAMNAATLAFAIDGAVAKARTAAFFSNDQAPLTSRTVRFISQSTVTQREVQSNPNAADPTVKGPGFVAPVGLGGHFPAGVKFAPLADLFAIEHTNRDSLIHPGDNAIRENGGGDDVPLAMRFGADFDTNQDVPAPESYGFVSGSAPTEQSRGIATLPGGVGLYQTDPSSVSKIRLVGGIGVFFPGPNGMATFEQDFQTADQRKAAHKKAQTTNERLNAPLVQQAEYMAVAAAGGVGTIAGIPLPANYVLPTGRIDLAGITLEIYGQNPKGLPGLLSFGKKLGTGSLVGGLDKPVNLGGDLYLDGERVPEGWLVSPHTSAASTLTTAEITKIITDGVAEANKVRAAIRLPIGQRTKMVLSVTDLNGEILALFRMPDATFFSIDVAVAKARNVAYYDDAAALQPQDKVDDNNNGVPDVAAGVSFTNRTFRYLAAPFFPESVDGKPSGDFSILNDPGINPLTAENVGPARPASQYQSVLGYDAFNPGTNFRETGDPNSVDGNQNGVVFFPGSTALYKNGVLAGGFGVSGDGVDQDDVVTFVGAGTLLPRPNSSIVRADEVFVRSVRLPFQKFPRNPHG